MAICFNKPKRRRRVRHAQALESQSFEQIVKVERGVLAQARAAFSRYRETILVIKSTQAAVPSNESSIDCVYAEDSVESRNVLEVANAKQDLLNSRVQCVTPKIRRLCRRVSVACGIGPRRREVSENGGLEAVPSGAYTTLRPAALARRALRQDGPDLLRRPAYG